MEILDKNSKPLDASKTQSVKVRLAQVYASTDSGSTLRIMNELKALNAKDLEDFTGWFNAAGYPTSLVSA